ncbi:IS5 family transposase [Gluconobacter oxydans]|uniref:IS5 family transposase n=1 Tax=Gluconobacter oxydans TaxID=442 RepID=UPI0039E87798
MHHQSNPSNHGTKQLGTQKGAHSEAFGRSRGGFTSKIHARCDNQGHPLSFVLTGGQVSDYEATDALMKLPVPHPTAMLADRGYDSDIFRQDLLTHGILLVISSRKGLSVPQKTDWRRYRDRNRIERMFNRLKQICCIATRFVIHEFPQPRHRKAVDQVFCQRDPRAGETRLVQKEPYLETSIIGFRKGKYLISHYCFSCISPSPSQFVRGVPP